MDGWFVLILEITSCKQASKKAVLFANLGWVLTDIRLMWALGANAGLFFVRKEERDSPKFIPYLLFCVLEEKWSTNLSQFSPLICSIQLIDLKF